MLSTSSISRAGGDLSYLALGDSYTIGEAVPEHARWPVQLAQQLRADGIGLAPPRIIATTGWTTDELSAAMDAAEPLGEWDFVSLLIGVNNQYRGRSTEHFREEFRALLERAIRLARHRPEHVLVLTIPDWGVTPFAQGRDRAAIGAAIDQFNAINAAEAKRASVIYVDVTPLSRQAAHEAGLIADDGLHPAGRMYAGWAALALPAVTPALTNPGA